VVAASTLQQVLKANKGKRITKARNNPFEFHVAPGLVVKGCYMKMMDRQGYPTLKKEVPMLDENGIVMKNDLEEDMMEEITTKAFYHEAEDPQKDEVPFDMVTSAVRFGADLIPMGEFMEEGVAGSTSSVVKIEILGYVPCDDVPKSYLTGPPYAIAGKDSLKAATLIASLAQALERQEKAAVCNFYKSNRSKQATLGALFPLPEPEYGYNQTIHLAFFELPHAGDVKMLEMESLQKYLDDEEKVRVCDDLIDSLMLPYDVLASGSVPSPFHRSWYQTVIQRAQDPDADLVLARSPEQTAMLGDPMKTPGDVLARSKRVLETFRAEFPLTKNKLKDDKKKKEKRSHTYKDYLSD